jgi:orotate phosphoribosyltransferase
MSENPLDESLQKEFLNLVHARNGHFKLESGHHGNVWLDLDLLFLRPKAIQRFVVELARMISVFNVDAVCGPLVGGALIGQSIASELGIEFFYTERVMSENSAALYPATYRLPSHLRKMIGGRNIAIVDDVINAGSAVRATLAELQSFGARPVVIGALLVLGDLGQKYLAEHNFPLRSISHLPNEIWTTDVCPLCASKIPLDKVDRI